MFSLIELSSYQIRIINTAELMSSSSRFLGESNRLEKEKGLFLKGAQYAISHNRLTSTQILYFVQLL